MQAEQLLSKDHPLLTLIKECLDDHPASRPRVGELNIKLQEVANPSECSLSVSLLKQIFLNRTISKI